MTITLDCSRGTCEGELWLYRVVQFAGETTWNVEDRAMGGYREFETLFEAVHWIEKNA